MILAVINQKGGMAKTTTALHLAWLWAPQGPVLLDVDKQNATRFHSIEGAKIGAADDADVGRYALLAAASPVIVDCPPDIEKAKHSLAAATHILVPCVPEQYAFEATCKLVEALGNVYPDKPVRVLATRHRPGSAYSRRQLMALKHEFDGRICIPVIHAAPAFELASEQGLTIFDTAPHSVGARQYRRVAQELQQWQQQTD